VKPRLSEAPGFLVHSFLTSFLLVCFLLLPAQAERGELIESKSKITFKGSSNVHSFSGQIKKLNGYIYGDSKDLKSVNFLKLEFFPDHFFTSNEARDENLRKMFGVKLYPIIVFKSTNLVVSAKKNSAKVEGKLFISGVTKKVSFPLKLSQTNPGEVRARGTLNIKLSDFGLVAPAPGFIRVKDIVNVQFDATVSWNY
jgi:polyisoprenoid-binding protein YceI